MDLANAKLGAAGGYAAEPVDVWGMGIVLFTMLVGSKCHIGRALIPDTPWDEPSESTSPEFAAYLTGELWQYDPWSRIQGQTKGKLSQKHQLTTDFLRRLLTVDPAKRISVTDIPRHPWCMTCVALAVGTDLQPLPAHSRNAARSTHARSPHHRHDGVRGPHLCGPGRPGICCIVS